MSDLTRELRAFEPGWWPGDLCERAADRIDQLEAAGTALLNAGTADDVVVAEAVWHELMGWGSS